jgi:tetratricopeptide (TPR) repeat protein
MNRGDFDASREDLARALELSRRVFGNDHYQTANVLTNLGVVNSKAGTDGAEGYYLEALKIYEKVYGANSPDVARILGNLAIVHAEAGRFDEALPYFERSLEVQEVIYGPNHPNVAQALTNYGLMKLQTGDPDSAVVALQRAADIRAGVGVEDISTSFTLYHLASARAELGEFDTARQLLERVVAIDERIFGPESVEVADDLDGLMEVNRTLGEEAKASEIERRINAINEKLEAQGSNG